MKCPKAILDYRYNILIIDNHKLPLFEVNKNFTPRNPHTYKKQPTSRQTNNQASNTLPNPFDSDVVNDDPLSVLSMSPNKQKSQQCIHDAHLLKSLDRQICTLKPRTESVITVQILNPEIGVGIIPNSEISKGVYLAGSIVNVNPKSNTALTTILNTNDNDITLDNITITLEALHLVLIPEHLKLLFKISLE